jgi:hypothetical protein
MPVDHEADELDRLIESRRNGESPAAPNTLSDALADLAGQLGGLAHQVELPDSADVWSRVAAGIDAHEQAQKLSRLERWWPSPSNRAFWAPTLAASLALVALLISEPDSTSAAFVEDVERLSAVASEALVDDVLTADERESVTALAAFHGAMEGGWEPMGGAVDLPVWASGLATRSGHHFACPQHSGS